MTAIRFDHVNKNYRDVEVFRDFTMDFEKGKIHVLMGASGCGKTTLLRLLLRLEKPDSGEILGLEGLKRSAVFQEDRLLANLTVSANIRLARPTLSGAAKRQFRKEIREWLERVGLPGLERKAVRELSGGMRRRVALLRALLAEADFYVFDEPLKGLDQENRERLLRMLFPVLRGKTVFWVTHDPDDLRFIPDACPHYFPLPGQPEPRTSVPDSPESEEDLC